MDEPAKYIERSLKNEGSAPFWRMNWSAAGQVKRSSVRSEKNRFKLSPNHMDGPFPFSTPSLVL
jgi:hypothetical protein